MKTIMKKVIRQKLIDQLKNLDVEEKKIKDQRLSQAFLSSLAYQESQTLALFLAMPFEFDTSEIILQALADGKQVLVPKTFDQGQMCFLPYDPAHLAMSKFGVLEPSQGEPVTKDKIDLILVPGLAWRTDGYRIGFGGGFYDRYLKDFQGHTVSLVYDFQCLDFDIAAYDIAVKEVIDEGDF